MRNFTGMSKFPKRILSPHLNEHVQDGWEGLCSKVLDGINKAAHVILTTLSIRYCLCQYRYYYHMTIESELWKGSIILLVFLCYKIFHCLQICTCGGNYLFCNDKNLDEIPEEVATKNPGINSLNMDVSYRYRVVITVWAAFES